MGDAYPRSEFKYAWNIAKFVQLVKRLDLECISNETMKEIIPNSWQQDPKERLIIDDILKKLIN